MPKGNNLPFVICRTLATFFIVESNFDSVFSSSFPKSSNILFKNNQINFKKNPQIWLKKKIPYTACSSNSILICLETVFNVPIESLITSNCSSCPCNILCCDEALSPIKRCDGLSNVE